MLTFFTWLLSVDASDRVRDDDSRWVRPHETHECSLEKALYAQHTGRYTGGKHVSHIIRWYGLSLVMIISNSLQMGKKSSYLNATEELVMPYEEISEVVASSYDGRFPPKNIFKYSASSSSSASNLSSNGTVGFGDLSSAGHVQSGSSPSASSSAFKAYSSSRNSSRSSSPSVNNRRSRSNSINRDDESTTTPPVKLHSSSTTTLSANTAADSINPIRSTPSQHLSSAVHPDHRLGWISTGLVPQFLFVSFYEKWYIKKIEVFCSGIDKLCFQIHSSASSLMKSSGSLSEMARLGSG